MDYETIVLQKEEGTATITLNRPEALNAWNNLMTEEAVEAIQDLANDNDIKVLILTGAGKGFSSGRDVGILAQLIEIPIVDEISTIGRMIRRLPNMATVALQIRNLDKPVIAAINGVCAGGAFGIAMACDIRIASENARFSQIFVRRGLIPDCGSTYWLPRLVGMAKACELVFTGDMIDATEAERIGLVSKVVPQEELLPTAKELARKIAEAPSIAVRLAKRALYKGLVEPDFASHLDYELYVQGICMGTEDFAEGVKSFLEKRPPVFKGK